MELVVIYCNMFVQRWLSSGLQRHVDCYGFTNISEVLTASGITAMIIIMLMNSYHSTKRYNPEDCHLCTHCHENHKCNLTWLYLPNLMVPAPRTCLVAGASWSATGDLSLSSSSDTAPVGQCQYVTEQDSRDCGVGSCGPSQIHVKHIHF
jgi:hypothetical protein